MNNPVAKLFDRLRASKRAAFIPFVPAGDPDLALTAELLPALAGAGADVIELGVPFSDPIADGPVIQAAYTRALNAKFKLGDMFDTVKRVTAAPGFPPVVAMASYSLVWKRGPEPFVADCLAAGLSGAVVPDLPVEEADNLARISRDAGFALTLLVTPTTAPDRAERIAAACTGFVYVVSVVGVTGDQAKPVAETVAPVLARLRTLTDRPLCVGFGVGSPEQVAALKDIADGVIVGTAIVKRLAVAADPARRFEAVADVADFARRLRAPLG